MEKNQNSLTGPVALDGNRQVIDPKLGVFPIMKSLDEKYVSIIGTGFYITRYGLFLTAKHVVDDLIDWKTKSLIDSRVCHCTNEAKIYMRKILMVTLINEYDLAICQADNFMSRNPGRYLTNMRAPLTAKAPEIGTKLATFAYPENQALDFTIKDRPHLVKCDYYEGTFLKHVTISANPSIQYPHFETSIKLKSGASGGPVFANEKVIGINCRGWDFSDGDELGNLSYIVPISYLLSVEIELTQLPQISWEYEQLKEQKAKYSIKELAECGHIDLEV